VTRLTFHGGVGTVTGSRTLFESGRARILVDCGVFQGPREIRERNWAPLPFDPSSLDAIVLTHAHLDHSGFLPLVASRGFNGPVYCTRGTRDLLRILLPDAGHLEEEAARHANKWGWSRHRPALPLFTQAQAEQCLRLLRPVDFHEEFRPAKTCVASYTRAGHVLGAACLSLRGDGPTCVFTGDVGRPVDPVMLPPEPLPGADVLVTESTYGDRRHPRSDPRTELAEAMNEAVGTGGVLLIPAFAVGRAQHVLHLIAELRRARRVPDVPVFLDSPMAIDATALLAEHMDEHRLDDAQIRRLYETVTLTRTTDESKSIDARSDPMVVVAGSGMAAGGRIVHHLARFLPDPKTLVTFVGYQSEGTLGRALVGGAKEVRILGRAVPVAARSRELRTLSAHADADELTTWLTASGIAPRRTFVTHGEAGASETLRLRLSESLGWPAVVPRMGSAWNVGG
jgi:metallo-beta-lactamase family protein